MRGQFKSRSGQRTWLAAIWYGAFVAACLCIYILRGIKSVDDVRWAAALLVTSKFYAPHLGAILISFFASKMSASKVENEAPSLLFWIALVCSITWNLFFLIPILSVCFAVGNLNTGMQTGSEICNNMSFLITPVIGFYFANGEPAPGNAGTGIERVESKDSQ